MSRVEKAPEPSMEDILASIRKIIAEEPIGTRTTPQAPLARRGGTPAPQTNRHPPCQLWAGLGSRFANAAAPAGAPSASSPDGACAAWPTHRQPPPRNRHRRPASPGAMWPRSTKFSALPTICRPAGIRPLRPLQRLRRARHVRAPTPRRPGCFRSLPPRRRPTAASRPDRKPTPAAAAAAARPAAGSDGSDSILQRHRPWSDPPTAAHSRPRRDPGSRACGSHAMLELRCAQRALHR